MDGSGVIIMFGMNEIVDINVVAVVDVMGNLAVYKIVS